MKMKAVSSIESIPANNTTSASPVKVAMHVLSVVRTDYRVMREATALMEAGFDVSIVDAEEDHTRPLEEDIHNIHVKHIMQRSWLIPSPRHFKIWFLIKYMRMIISATLRLMQIRADIYHAHDANALPACFLAAWFRHKPLIFDAHELPLDEPAITRWPRLYKLATRALASILSNCSGIIATSPPTVQAIEKLYHVSSVTLVRNVPIYRNVPESDRLRKHLDLGPEVCIALYQGYLQDDRGLDRLVRAAEFLKPNTLIVMMGKAMPSTQAHLKALIASKGVAERVKILPPVPYAELLDWTASADIGLAILPLDFSLAVQMMLPNKFFEYLMAGLPVLASPLRAIAEIIEANDVGQVLNSLEPIDVAESINALLADKEGLARMHRNALIAAQQEFHWEKERTRLLGLYRDILGMRNEEALSSRTQSPEGDGLV